MGRGNENGLPNCLYANGKPESRMCNLVDRLDSLGERGKHRQAEGGVRCETHRSAPASFRYAATNPLAKTSRALATKPVQGVNERWKKSQRKWGRQTCWARSSARRQQGRRGRRLCGRGARRRPQPRLGHQSRRQQGRQFRAASRRRRQCPPR